MANEIKIIQKSGLTGVTAVLHANGAQAAVVTLLEVVGSPRSYRGDMPAILNGVPGEYNIAFLANSGLSDEILIGTGTIFWDGSAEVDELDINSTLTGSDAGRLI